ncbi:MAG: ribonuclease domain-containing protein [Gemmatimonadota bacterium]
MRAIDRFLILVLVALATLSGPVAARTGRDHAAIGEIAVADLPREARDTLALIRRGGPFPYRKDGTVFQNRERRLPIQQRGYYTEYTVRTPGRGDRGARRIIAGKGATGSAASSGEYYYTDNHYQTFRRIRE